MEREDVVKIEDERTEKEKEHEKIRKRYVTGIEKEKPKEELRQMKSDERRN